MALLELDLPYNGEACETKSMPPTQNLQVKNFFNALQVRHSQPLDHNVTHQKITKMIRYTT